MDTLTFELNPFYGMEILNSLVKKKKTSADVAAELIGHSGIC